MKEKIYLKSRRWVWSRPISTMCKKTHINFVTGRSLYLHGLGQEYNKHLICVFCSWLCRGGHTGGGGHIRVWGSQIQLGVDAEGCLHHQTGIGAIDLCESWDDGPAGPSKMRRKWPQYCSCSLKSLTVVKCEKGPTLPLLPVPAQALALFPALRAAFIPLEVNLWSLQEPPRSLDVPVRPDWPWVRGSSLDSIVRKWLYGDAVGCS